jgi:hypothetical protein
MALPQVTYEGDYFQIWKVAMKTLITQLHMADSGWFSSFEVGHGKLDLMGNRRSDERDMASYQQTNMERGMGIMK